jgi:hypothetical protein
MNDTPPDVAREVEQLMAQRSGSDRLRMACEMFDLARALAVAAIRAAHPGISEEHLRIELFERFYGEDFSEQERARIVASINSGPAPRLCDLARPATGVTRRR